MRSGNVVDKVGIITSNKKIHKSIESESDLNQILDLAKNSGYDTAVMIYPIRYDNRPWLKPGYGIRRTPRTFCPYALFVINVYNTETREELALRWGFNITRGGPCSQEMFDWQRPKDRTKFDPEVLKRVEKVIKSKIDKEIDHVLGRLGLK
ncbi:MAG: hypothetical protein HRT38_20095 [Alteromonadaceae bacterium]|nr:hypothetical protein [Alteromonadaceae bacterium]